MTRSLSDAQLDAEAAAPDYSLRWLIVDLRRALWMETPAQLHQRASSGISSERDERGWPKDSDEGGLGVPFSEKFHRWLGTSQWERGPNPTVRPAMASIVEASERCHARHSTHARPYYSRSLCGQLLFEVAYLGQEPADLAWLHALPLEQVERMLSDALRHARSWRLDIEARNARSSEPEPIKEFKPYRSPAA